MTDTTQETNTAPETTTLGATTTTTTSTTSTTSTTTTSVKVGEYTGQVRMFNRSRGYGFITVHSDTEAKDVFVHQTNICPAQSTYRSLSTGEYVSFDISDDEKRQALNVRGVNGGSLRCDAPRRRRNQEFEEDGEDGEEGDDENQEDHGHGGSRQGGGRQGGGRQGGSRQGGGRQGGRQGGGRNNDRYSDKPKERGVNLSEYIPKNAVAAVSRMPDENEQEQ
jgi:cold shock CspA family protein